MSFIGWLDHSEAEQRQVRELLRMLEEKGTVDDLGIGTIRDAISNRLFPGTSIIQSRARYFLFIPWIFQHAASRHRSDVLKRAEVMERRLIEAIRESGDLEGLIGRVSGKDLRTLPSAIYWAGLSAYGIFQRGNLTRAQYGQAAARKATTYTEDELADRGEAFWHQSMPMAPDGFFDFVETDFRLRREEARWLSERVLSTEQLQGPSLLSGYIRQLRSSTAPPRYAFWSAPLPPDTADDLARIVWHAERFSLAIEGAALVYNVMLHEARDDDDRDDATNAETRRQEMARWAQEASELSLETWPQELPEFWRLLASTARIPPTARAFVDEIGKILSQRRLKSIVDDPGMRSLIRARELQHKKQQARFHNAARLSSWNGASGLARLDFRWTQVHRFLQDIDAGLNAKSRSQRTTHAAH